MSLSQLTVAISIPIPISTEMGMSQWHWNISSRFCRNSEAFAWELVEIWKKCFYYIYMTMFVTDWKLKPYNNVFENHMELYLYKKFSLYTISLYFWSECFRIIILWGSFVFCDMFTKPSLFDLNVLLYYSLLLLCIIFIQ